MSPLRNWAAGSLLVLALSSAHAARSGNQSDALTALLPARAAYFDPAKSGTGVAVDVGADGFVFLTYYGYDTLGAPTWYAIQGPWTPSNEAQRRATGIIGRLNQPLLYATGGQCITCDFTQGPSAQVSPLPVTVAWTSPRHLELQIGNQDWHMDAVEYAVADSNLLAGTWQLTISWDGDSAPDAATSVAARTQIMKVEPGVAFGHPPLPTNVSLDANAAPSITLPPPGSIAFTVDQVAPCAPGPLRLGQYGDAFADIFSAIQASDALANFPSGAYLAPMLWYDAATRRGGLDVVTRATGVDTTTLVLGPNNIHFDLYIEPDHVVGHGIVQGKDLKKVPSGYWLPDATMLNLVMQRVPDSLSERSIYPCQLY